MGKQQQLCFLGYFFWPAVQRVNLSIFHQALINIVHQTQLTFSVEIEKTNGHCSLLRSNKSVGDSAEKFISIHALGRERLLGLSCDLPSHPLKILFFALRQKITCREFFSQFSPYQPSIICVFYRAWSAPATNHRPQSERCTPRRGRSLKRTRHVQSSRH